MKTDLVSIKQLRALYVLGILSPVIRLIPNSTLRYAGSAAWLSPILALLPVVGYGYFLGRVAKSRKSGETAPVLLCRVLGKRAGRMILILTGLWLAFYAGFLLRMDGERLRSTIFRNVNLWFFVAVGLSVCTVIALGNLKSLARMAELFLPVLGLVIALSCGLALVDVKLENLLPVTVYDLPGAAAGAVPILDVLSVSAFYLLFLGEIEKSPGAQQVVTRGLLWLMLGIWLLVGTVTGTLSAPLANHLNNPYFVMARDLSVFGVNERIEAVIIALWVVTDLIYIVTLMRASVVALQGAILYGSRKRWVLVLSGGVLLSAVLCAGNAFTLSRLSEVWVPAISMGFTLGLLPAIALWGYASQKRRKRKIRGAERDTIS